MKYLNYLLIFIIAFFLAWQLKPNEETEIKTKIKYLNRYITKHDTVTKIIPIKKYVFKRDTILDTIVIVKPVAFKSFNLAPIHPIRFNKQQIIYSFYDLKEQRFKQNVYDIPEYNRYAIMPYLKYAFYSGPAIGIEGCYSIQRINFYGLLELNRVDVIKLAIGVKYKWLGN